VDSGIAGAIPDSNNLSIGSLGNSLEYRNFGMFTREVSIMGGVGAQSLARKKRDEKLEEKQQRAALIAEDPLNILNAKKSRGRKTNLKLQQEQNALDELRKKRKRLITVLFQEVSELELLSHLKTVILIIRNLSFIRNNEHHLIKSLKLIEIVTSLFVDMID